MSDLVLVSLVTGVPPTIAAIAALLVSLRNSRKADTANRKADVQAEKTEVIHELVNSNLTKVKDELSEAKAIISDLRQRIERLTIELGG